MFFYTVPNLAKSDITLVQARKHSNRKGRLEVSTTVFCLKMVGEEVYLYTNFITDKYLIMFLMGFKFKFLVA